MPTRLDPAATYATLALSHESAVVRGQAWDRRLSTARAVVFALGLLCWWLVIGPKLLAPAWLAMMAAGFVALVVVHEVMARRLAMATRRLGIVDRARRRLAGDLSGAEDDGARFSEPGHPFADDLDLFGPASLFARLCVARTGSGRATLASWLQVAATRPTVALRQAAVDELRDRVDLREDLLVLGEAVDRGVDPGSLRRWAQQPQVTFPPGTRILAVVLSALSIGAVAGWFGGEVPADAVLAALAAIAGWSWTIGSRASAILRHLDRPSREVALLADVLARLERESFRAPRLAELHAALASEGTPPSVAVRALQRRVDLIDSSRNAMFAPFAILLLWDTHLAMSIEAWRARHGAAVARWLEAIGEIEALLSLAGWAFDNPDHPFPELTDGGPLFEAEGLGHPLLTAACVRNDVALADGRRLLLVSGSNMSGKSTLLRSVGCNVVLALAGAPVRARRLRLSELQLGASIRVQDSLHDGRSRFYAEITRLRQIRDLADGERPLLFLLDELLAGTNSEDRRVGAEAVIRALLDRGAAGLASTHDLALTAVADELGATAANVHFEDTVDGDRVVFDYTLRPGVVTRGNALALMRAIGLTT